MEFIETGISGLIEIHPKIWSDSRGHFFESYQKKAFEEAGISGDFVQSNQSFSERGVIRGLHLQLEPHGQAKLVRVISGAVLDIVVDARPDSPTFGEHYKCLLEGKRNNMLYVPRGFAHGFSCMEDAVFQYGCDNYYSPESETGIRWNDPDLAIDWEIREPLVSEKDQLLPTFEEFKKIIGK